jgi:predicted SAM-dependent methyltransferase
MIQKIYQYAKPSLKKLRWQMQMMITPPSVPADPRKLHLGCGDRKISGWTNVDVSASEATDMVDDIRKLKKIKDGSIDQIYACHVLEHFSTAEVREVLQRWHSVLAPGGTLRLSVPDMDRIVKIYHSHFAHFQVPGHQPWTGLIYGGQRDQYDFHKTGFNFAWMKFILKEIGFTDIHEYPHEPHFIENFSDSSTANQPFNEFISLNVIARKM